MSQKIDEDCSLVIDRTRKYKVFISYCWSSPAHEEWVYNLAERLMSDGIEVKYDKWDLKAGQDKFAFMESMVNDETINKVLVICNSGYKEKADNRTGGVGTETQIITAELYNKVEQTKFIPVVAEQGDSFDTYMPTFIKSRIGIDLSSDESYEDEYERLLRTITERPKYRKPKLGRLPSYLFEDEENNFKTRNIIASFKNNLYKNPQQALMLVEDFFQEFINSLDSFQIHLEDWKEPYDEIIYNRIHEMRKLRDDYVNFLDVLVKSDFFDIDKIITLFEELYKFTYYRGNERYSEEQMDHYRFLITELFLYTVVILLKNKVYDDVNILINNKYFIDDRYSSNENPNDFTIFWFRNISLEYRNKRLKKNLIDYTADTIISRATIQGVNYRNQIIDADILLYYLSFLKTKSCYTSWFPMTYIYAGNGISYYRYRMDILKRLISKRHFEKVKVLFGVDTVDELKSLFRSFNEAENANVRHPGTVYSVMPIKHQINIDEIATSV